MTQLIVSPPALTYEELKAIVLAELTKEEDQTLECSIRGLARLLGLSTSTLTDSRKLKSGIPMGVLRRVAECSEDILPETLKPIAGFDYRTSRHYRSPNSETNLLPLEVVTCIIRYYAYDAQKPHQRARQLEAMFSDIGAYAFFNKILSDEKAELEPQVLAPLAPSSVPLIEEDLVYAEETPLDKALLLIHKLESYRLKREEVIAFLENLNLLTVESSRNTGYRGVKKKNNKWQARISVEGVSRFIGSYDTEDEAARAYDNYAKVIHGNKARLNFPVS